MRYRLRAIQFRWWKRGATKHRELMAKQSFGAGARA
jgi:hypothetical protein